MRDETIVAFDPETGDVWTRHQAVGRILRSLPFGFLVSWLAWLPLLGTAFGRLYDLVARNRTQVSQFFGQPACGLPHAAPEGSAGAAAGQPSSARRMGRLGVIGLRELLLLFLIFISAYQMLSTNKWLTQVTSIHQEGWMRATLRYPRMFQRWNMFAPNPPRGEGWLVIDACTADGRNIDPQTNKAPDFGTVDYHSDMDFGQMWRIYTKRIRKKNHSVRRGALRNYLSKRHRYLNLPKTDRLTSYNVYWVRHRSPTPDEWYRPIPKDHWMRGAARGIGGIFGEAAARKTEASSASWVRGDVPEASDRVIFEKLEKETGRPVKPSCTMVTSHVSSDKAAKLPCKKASDPKPHASCKPDKKSSRKRSKRSKGKSRTKKDGDAKKRGEVVPARGTSPDARGNAPSGTRVSPESVRRLQGNDDGDALITPDTAKRLRRLTRELPSN